MTIKIKDNFRQNVTAVEHDDDDDDDDNDDDDDDDNDDNWVNVKDE